MTSSPHGTNTSDVEVVQVDRHGLWIHVLGTEYFLPYDEYPWFRNAKVCDVLDVCLLHEHHLHWPALDVDLSVESLAHPEDFPLKFR